MRQLIIAIFFLSFIPLHGQQSGNRPAPYMQCHFNGQKDPSYLPLQDFAINAEIAGSIADVTLTQTFVNTFNVPLEVRYVFPGSTKSAIYDLTMTVGDRIVHADIQEKYQARTTYQKAVDTGYRASLLEQTRPNVFQMNVGNIMPRDTIIVSLKYTEFIESINGYYQFVVPTTIGERYAGENQGEAEPVITSYVPSSQSPYPLHIDIELNSPVPIGQVRSSTHKIDFNMIDPMKWTVSLNPTEQYAANRDFIFEYQLRGAELESGVLLHKGTTENFFMVQIQPPKQVSYTEVPPREYLFVLDVSGSMQGFPMATAKDLLEVLLEDLKPNDIFNIIPFEFASSKLFTTSQLATPDNIKRAKRFMRMRMSSGGTNMASAFRDVYESITDEPISRSIVLITDGQVEAEKRVFQEIRNNLYKANVFAFGIGVSVNRYLIEGVANAGMGEAFMVTNSVYAREKAMALANYIKRPALTNIQVNFTDNLVYEISPPSLPDVLSERPLTIYGKYEGEMTDKIVISGTTGSGVYQKIIYPPKDSEFNPALKYLWARSRLKDIEDFGAGIDQQRAITELGLKYSLLTTYTSFVAVDSEVANVTNQRIAMNQPLAKPANPVRSNSYRQRLNATGAVSRAADNRDFNIYLPAQSDVTAPVILLSWNDDGPGPYTITVSDIFNQVIFTKEVIDQFAWLEFKDFEYDRGLYLVEVTNQNGETSGEIGLKKSNGLGDHYRELYNTSFGFAHNDYLQAINDLINSQLIVDAFTLVEIAVMNYPESATLQDKRNEIWSMAGLH